MAINQEEQIMLVKMHKAIFVLPVLVCILGAVTLPIYIGIVILIVGIFLLIKTIIAYISMELVITTKRVHGHIGLIKSTELDSALNKIDNVQAGDTLLGKIFGYGYIHIQTNRNGIKFVNVPNPTTIYLWLIHLTSSKDLSILLLSCIMVEQSVCRFPFLDLASVF